MTLDYAEKLALHGGPKAKRTPFPQAKRHGEAEKRHLSEVIDSDTLFYFLGTKVRGFEQRFSQGRLAGTLGAINAFSLGSP